MKNPHGKTVTRENAYAVYGDDPRLPGWTWYVLKTYQSPEKAQDNKYARAFCLVTNDIVGAGGELGDTYLSEISGRLLSGVDVRGQGQHAVRAALDGINLFQ